MATVHEYSVDVRGGLLGLLEDGLHPGGQEVGRADVVHAPAAVGGEGTDDVLDDAEQRDELFLRAVEVVRRQQPEGDDLDVGLGAPAEEFLDLVGPGPVSLGGGTARRLRPAPVAVHDDPDVLGHLVVVKVAFHPACIEPDQQAAQVVAQVHVFVSPSVQITVPRGRHPTAAEAPLPLGVQGLLLSGRQGRGGPCGTPAPSAAPTQAPTPTRVTALARHWRRTGDGTGDSTSGAYARRV